MDLTSLKEYVLVSPLLACLVVGYVIKHTPALDKVANEYIPVIVTILGAILGVLATGLTLESVVYGAISGLASTGLHQVFGSLINRKEDD